MCLVFCLSKLLIKLSHLYYSCKSPAVSLCCTLSPKSWRASLILAAVQGFSTMFPASVSLSSDAFSSFSLIQQDTVWKTSSSVIVAATWMFSSINIYSAKTFSVMSDGMSNVSLNSGT